MTTDFREATARDVPRMLEIIAQAQAYLAAQGVDQWQNGYPNRDNIMEDIRAGDSYVLERDGWVCGMAAVIFGGEPSYDVLHGGVWTTPEPYACIHRVALDASLRGTGAAAALMGHAEALVRARGVGGIRIDTHADNVVMQRMLKKNGYARCGVIYLKDLEVGAARDAYEKRI